MANNKISTSKKEIYTKLLDIAEKYTDIKDSDFLKTGLFGYMTESMAMILRDGTFHKSMLYNESFLNTAILPQTVYNWAKMFNIEVQKATPKYAEIDIVIPIDAVSNYGKLDNETGLRILTLDKQNLILAGDYYFSLEKSIQISYKNTDTTNKSFKASLVLDDKYPTTSFQSLVSNSLITVIDGDNLIVKARVYQYKTTSTIRQITSTSFLNKVQTYKFEDQFCGARLYYEDGKDKDGKENYVEVELQYSDMNKSNGTKVAYYNLKNEDELEIIFKSGVEHFMPSANTKIKVDIYTTKALEAPAHFTGDALMLFKENDLKSLPLVIQFNPTNLLGGKNTPSLADIKTTIINEISTRNTITTKAELDNYFAILTALIEDINDGKVTFIKKRDDILKRTYNSYLLLRDNTDDSSDTEEISTGVLSPVIPTNTINVIAGTVAGSPSEFIHYKFPKFTIDGKSAGVNDNEFYICPFNIFVTSTPSNFVKYIYNLTDCETKIYFSNESEENLSDVTIIPNKIRLYRGFDETTYGAQNFYTLEIVMTTNAPIGRLEGATTSGNLKSASGSVSIYTKNSSHILFNLNNASEASISSIEGENGYTTTLKLQLSVDENEFNIVSGEGENATPLLKTLYGDTISVNTATTSTVRLPSNVQFTIDLKALQIGGNSVGIVFDMEDELILYQHLDDIMESSLIINDTISNGHIGLTDVPVVHSSFFKTADATASKNKKDGFIKQLFTYINVLKNNLNRLETSTFFNLKFYNTYGYSNYYYTDRTNIKLDMEIVLLKEYRDTEGLEAEIRAYVRKLVDKMNESQSINISSLLTSIADKNTYGPYIKYIKFAGLNGTFNQYIKKLTDVDERDYAPEWLNLDYNYLKNSSKSLGQGVFFSYE